MDKRVTFAVAGAGKTTAIVDSLDLERRHLVITYADNNYTNLRLKIVRKFGFFPPNISLQTYFSFLHTFCYLPFLLMQMQTRGLRFDTLPIWTTRLKRDDRNFYVGPDGRLYHNRIATLLYSKNVIADLCARVERYFDAICIDEVQDFGGYDFDLLLAICSSNVDVLLVGDFYQHTYVTSHDGSKNRTLYDNYEKYKRRFIDTGIRVDTTSLVKSYRCSPTVCEFIRQHLGIEIYSHNGIATDVLTFDSQAEANWAHADNSVVKLFYQKHHAYGCHSQNWGGSKGDDHHNDVCVVMYQGIYKAFIENELRNCKPLIRNKLYVACSRARRNLYLVADKYFKGFITPQECRSAVPQLSRIEKEVV